MMPTVVTGYDLCRLRYIMIFTIFILPSRYKYGNKNFAVVVFFLRENKKLITTSFPSLYSP